MADYKDTIFLPKTSFPMKASLAEREPQIVKRWKEENLYQQLRKIRKGHPKFILHWGPPYANGHLHVGHAFNGIFKDIVARGQSLLGKDAPLVPGWDCHGLPIEWKIEEQYRAEGKKKEDVPIGEFRQECRHFTEKWKGIQAQEFERFGILCDIENSYNTMAFEAEAATTQEFFTFLEKGYVYKGSRPIMWSVVEKTALAEAEVEYREKTSPAIYVRFPLKKASVPILEGAACVIWTTTPWTLPGNRGIAYGPEISYVALKVKKVAEGSLACEGEKLLVAKNLLNSFCATVGIDDYEILETFPGKNLEGTIGVHPFVSHGYGFEVPFIPGSHVTTETGTGFVHTAPGHGPDDFELGKKFHLEIADTVNDDGTYTPAVPLFAGQHIFKIEPQIIDLLKTAGQLVHYRTIVHSYPHSWRSKAPLIFRTTPQWFISLSHNDLREKALEAINSVTWYPPQGKNRLSGMVLDRPDWCISRQRSWGVPLPLFLSKKTGNVLIDPKINARIVEIIRQEGCDAWFESDPDRFLAPDYSKEDFIQVKDILDVWFDSGSTQGFVLEQRSDLQAPADLYLEGSDQHRGWFQSSLLIGCGTRGKAPFKAVVTHGFTVDEQGRKMSKSLGNTVSPLEVAQDLGIEILRLWVVSCDFRDDLRLGKELLKTQQEIYRRYRNTVRYLLGALNDQESVPPVDYENLPLLEKWVLHRLQELQKAFTEAAHTYDYQNFYSKLHTFCSTDLSAFYLDIRKDVLYCDSPTSLKRQASLYVMDTLFTFLVHWLAPALPFTSEEAWLTRFPDKPSIHLSTLPSLPSKWKNDEVADHFEKIRLHRGLITTALEEARRAGTIGSSLQALVTVFDPTKSLDLNIDFAELSIVSQLTIRQEDSPEVRQTENKEGLQIRVEKAPDTKCERCWKYLPEVGSHPTYQDLCNRCATVLTEA